MTDPDKKQAKILIVDDYVDDIRILSDVLQPDYEVFAATDGLQALSRVASNPPDIILLDVEMPGMSGHEVCRKLKADTATREIPIIFITAKDEAHDEAEGLALGAIDYITKPFRLGVVQARLKTNLKLKREMDLRQQLAEDLKELNNELENKVREQVAKLQIADQEVRASEEMLRVVLENILDLVFMTDDDQNFTFICNNVSHIIGFDLKELQSMGKVTRLIPSAATFTKGLEASETVRDLEQVIIDKKGDRRVFLINIRRVAIGESTRLWTCREITHRKKLEDRLRQSYKMEAIGTLAGGIAHDFNNILTAIVGYTEISRSSVDEKGPIKNYLSRVLEASTRAKDLVNQILMFSRETEQELRPMQIALPVKEALHLIRASIPTTIEIKQDVRTDATVLADPTQVHQLVMNLCTNAAHSMRKSGGTLTVIVGDQAVHSKELNQYPELRAGKYVKIFISDTGHGIPPDLIDRIFDPFFSTKEKGEGTGMGLSVVHGIIQNHRGTIQVRSRVDQGTTFEIMLPSIREIPAEEGVTREVEISGGNERILFVDDEQMIVDVGQYMLETQGYHVTTATSPSQALEIFEAHPENFDLIVTDMTMPKMTGLVLAKKILAIRPDIPIIMCTGFSETLTEEAASGMGISDIIYKPILNRDMAEKVRRILDAGRKYP